MARILVIDDEPGIRRALRHVLAAAGHEVAEADSGDAALDGTEARRADLVLLDLKMPGRDGLGTLAELRRRDPTVPCLLMTAHGSVRTAVEAMRAGAFDYVSKPFDNEEVVIVVERALEMRRLASELDAARDALAAGASSGIVGSSGAIQAVRDAIRKAAASDETVLIAGETGTGKELVARAIHSASARGRRHIVTVDCGVLPADLVTAELFGAERGAYTGAHQARKGRFEQAAGGTLFLDEIGNLPLGLQPTLLRALQERKVARLGGAEIDVDVRVIAATNEDLGSAVSAGRFRSDLYHRLNVIPILLPPLRTRGEDIPLLIDHFVATIANEAGGPPKLVSAEARDLLAGHAWPGNVRELQNVLKRAFIMGDGEAIVASDLPAEIRGDASAGVEVSGGAASASLADEVRAMAESYERQRIVETLKDTAGNRREAARRLGLAERTFFRKLSQYGLEEDA